MGFRTVIILNNDQCHEWQNDSQLGTKIAHAMNHAMYANHAHNDKADIGYGRVVECAHADEQTLCVIDSLTMTPMAHSRWSRDVSHEAAELELLKRAAEKLGYKLIKQSKKED